MRERRRDDVGGVRVSRSYPFGCSRRWAAGVASCIALAFPGQAAAQGDAPESPAVLDEREPGATDAKIAGGEPSARDEAAQRFEAARVLYAQGNYELAAVELERAYTLVPDPRVLYKLGKLWLHLQRHARARRAFEKYLEESGTELSPEAREQLKSDLELLRGKTAELEIHVNVSGTEVLVDGVLLGTSPLAVPIVVDAGERQLVLRKDGYASQETRLTLAGNEARRVNAVLEPVDRPTPARSALPERPRATVPAPRAESNTAPDSTLTWVAWSVTGALAAGAAGAGVFGLVAASELDTLKRDPNASRDALERHSRRAELGLLTADILAGATVLAAAGALYLTFSSRGSSPDRPPHAISVRISPAAVSVATHF